MAAAKEDRVTLIFDQAYALQEEYNDVLARRAANRRVLRDMGAVLSPEENAAVEEIYPRRAANGAVEDDQVTA